MIFRNLLNSKDGSTIVDYIINFWILYGNIEFNTLSFIDVGEVQLICSGILNHDAY